MQPELILLISNTNNKLIPFFSNSTLYTWNNGIPTTNNDIIKKSLLNKSLKDIEKVKPDCYSVYGATFNKFSTVSSVGYYNEFVILHGNNLCDRKVFIVISLVKGYFRSFLDGINNNQSLSFVGSIVGLGEETLGLTNKQIFLRCKNMITLKSDTSKIRTHFPCFYFFNEEGKIVDSVYCSTELTKVDIERCAEFKLKC